MTTKFRLLTEVDTPTVIGKAWWNEALKLTQGGDARRAAMIVIGAGAAFMVLPPLASAVFGDSDDGPSTNTVRKPSLDLQRQNGWSFGVADEARSLQFIGGSPDPSLRQRLPALVDDLAPTNPAHRPLYVPTLFQSLKETSPPAAASTEDALRSSFVPLADVIQPVRTAGMSNAEVDARWLRSAFKSRTGGFALIVDLPGPEAVAFAAELSDTFDPVFLFDNWPHPRGVVPAHMTLAAAVSQQDRFAQTKASRSPAAPPMFILDRNRLAPYTDDASQFDNRSMARLPSAAWLKTVGVNRVLYVAPNSVSVLELDDVNEDLLAYGVGGIDVRAVQVADYYPAGSADDAAALFGSRYGLPQTPPPPPAAPTPSSSWVPTQRTSAFASGMVGSEPSRRQPPNFGTVPVVVDPTTGIMLGALLYRAGSWNNPSYSSSYSRSGSSNRTSSWSFGGG